MRQALFKKQKQERDEARTAEGLYIRGPLIKKNLMGHDTFTLRAKRWIKGLMHYINERIHGLDFSMVYVGQLQREVTEFHGYSMTDADDMKAIPIDTTEAAFLDVGCVHEVCSGKWL